VCVWLCMYVGVRVCMVFVRACVRGCWCFQMRALGNFHYILLM